MGWECQVIKDGSLAAKLSNSERCSHCLADRSSQELKALGVSRSCLSAEDDQLQNYRAKLVDLTPDNHEDNIAGSSSHKGIMPRIEQSFPTEGVNRKLKQFHFDIYMLAKTVTQPNGERNIDLAQVPPKAVIDQLATIIPKNKTFSALKQSFP